MLLVDAEHNTYFAFASCNCFLVFSHSCKGCCFPTQNNLAVFSVMGWGWALSGTNLFWCLPSRCSVWNYTSLHGTSSSQFTPKPLDYSSFHLVMEVLLLVRDCEPLRLWSQGFQPSLHRKVLFRNLPHIRVMSFSGAFKLSKPCKMDDHRQRMYWLVTAFCDTSMNTVCATASGADYSCLF